MTLHILKNTDEVTEARRMLRHLGIDCSDGIVRRLLKKLHLLPGPVFYDVMKGWDIFQSAGFLIEHLKKDDSVLDIGAYASEILPALHLAGFCNLTGIDLNPEVVTMPFSHRIRYLSGDFYRTGLPDQSFSAITAISVIEHGYDPERLFPEVSRLLRPGGYFIASVDYWPEKIDTKGISVFGLEWIVFSRPDIQNLFDTASRYVLTPVGDLDFDAADPLVAWQGKRYTFAWMVLRKAA